jgi:hypothetical protein
MASAGFIESMFGGVEASMKRALKQAFSYVLDGNLRFGHVAHQTRAENMGMFFLNATTHGTANAEFSVVHGMGRTPYLAMQVLALDAINTQMVPLRVTRAADGSRIYLASSSTGAAISLLVE